MICFCFRRCCCNSWRYAGVCDNANTACALTQSYSLFTSSSQPQSSYTALHVYSSMENFYLLGVLYCRNLYLLMRKTQLHLIWFFHGLVLLLCFFSSSVEWFTSSQRDSLTIKSLVDVSHSLIVLFLASASSSISSFPNRSPKPRARPGLFRRPPCN